MSDFLNAFMQNLQASGIPVKLVDVSHLYDPQMITSADLREMSADDLQHLALEYTAAAHNALMREEYGKAKYFQTQATLWGLSAEKRRQSDERATIARNDAEREQPDLPEKDASSAGEPQPVS